MRKRFGKCLFDSGTRQLWRSDEDVPLSPKGLALLELLLERAPNAISKEEIQTSLWPETFVSEASLTTLISEIRAAIDDSAQRPRFVRTVHRFGYAFCGEVTPEVGRGARSADPDFHCRVVWGDREVSLAEGENLLGRDPDVAIWIDLGSVSRRHARILISGGVATLEDLGSRNGTYVGDRKVTAPVRLANGDEIKMGKARLVFRSFGSVGTTESEVREDSN